MKNAPLVRHSLQRPCILTAALVISFLAETSSYAAKILYVVNSFADAVTPSNANDQEVLDRLTSQGHTVTLADDTVVSAADAAGQDLILFSSSTASGEAGVNALSRNTLRSGRIPFISYEPGLYDELLLQTATTFGNTAGHTELAIAVAAKGHPLAAGKSGVIPIVNPGETAVVSASALPLTIGGEPTIIATNAPSAPAVDLGRIAIWAYDVGAKLADNTTICTSRRVAFFYNATTAPGAYNKDATDLFDAAIKWALQPPAAVPVAIVLRTPTPDQTNVALDTSITAEIEDGSVAQVNQTSIKLTLNGAALTPTVSKTGTRTKVTAKPSSPLASSTSYTAVLTFSDTAAPPNTITNSWKFTTTRPALTLSAFAQTAQGLVVIEAENFHTNAASATHRWEFATTPAGYSADGSMYSLPDSGASISMPDAMTTSPRLDYRISFSKTGTHYLWIRGSDGGGDSIHAGIDDVDPAGSNLDNMDAPDCCGDRAAGGVIFTWVKGTDTTPETQATFEITTVGEHSLHLWMREDGMILDKILITTDPSFTPTGRGPDETSHVGQAIPPSITSVKPATDEIGVPVNANIEIVVTDGTTQVAPNSIQLSVNGTAVTPKVTKAGNQTTILYDPPNDLPGGARIEVKLAFGDTATPPNTKTLTTVFTTDRPAVTLPAFAQAADGLVSIEAENFHANVAQGAHKWLFAATPAGFSGDGTMYSLPDSGASIGLPDALTMSPRLDYKINFTKTGTHYLWIRGSDGGGDSIHAGIDAVDSTGTNLDNMDSPDCCGTRAPGGSTLTWVNGTDTTAQTRSTFEITTAGEHILHLSMREDGMILDKIVIATTAAFTPTGQGPAETRGGGDAPKLAVSRTGNAITIAWTGSGALQQADTVVGPWSNAPTQSNPQTVTVSGGAKFYRVR